MTKSLIKPELRFKLDAIAAKYNVPNKGLTIGQAVAGILKAANDLAADEKKVLGEICSCFGASLKDFEKQKKGLK